MSCEVGGEKVTVMSGFLSHFLSFLSMVQCGRSIPAKFYLGIIGKVSGRLAPSVSAGSYEIRMKVQLGMHEIPKKLTSKRIMSELDLRGETRSFFCWIWPVV